MTSSPHPGREAGARRQRALVAVVQLATLSCWFSATAVAPALLAARRAGPHVGPSVLLTSSVQIGFVVGATVSAMTSLADRVAPARLVAISAALAALCTAALALFARGFADALALRALTGVALAGVYPITMKLTASWSSPADRGKAFGVLIGALTLGSAVPHLIRGMADLPWRSVLLVAAVVTATGALMAATTLRAGPRDTRTASRLNPRPCAIKTVSSSVDSPLGAFPAPPRPYRQPSTRPSDTPYDGTQARAST
ncbi:MFS transporter [Streptomyces sp. NPDC004065]|uniref:MFS transporter n=1 Tax=Streptomyces sp. NPDC004065 TaxID=3364689 RepID=UPI0038506A02